MPWDIPTKQYIRNNGRNTGSTVWDKDAVAAQVIDSGGHDTHDQDIADGITQTLNINGINAMLADLNVGTFKLTNVADGVAAADGINKSQLDAVDVKASAWTISGADIYRASGNVGIGTATPGVELDVTGAINATGEITGNTLVGTLQTAAQTNITSLGTLTALDVDNININGNTITATTGSVNITPAAGSAIVLDGTINVDAGVITGVTDLTATNLTGTLQTAAQANITSVGTLNTLTVDDLLRIGTSASSGAVRQRLIDHGSGNATVDVGAAPRHHVENIGNLTITLSGLPTSDAVFGDTYEQEGMIVVDNGASPGTITLATSGEVIGTQSTTGNIRQVLTYIIQRISGTNDITYIWSVSG